MSDTHSSLRVAVLIEREKEPNAWEAWRFRVADVLADDGQFGDSQRVLRGKIYWLAGPGEMLVRHWRRDFPPPAGAIASPKAATR